MNTPLRLLIAAALLSTIAACGNKGPLVHPSAPTDASIPAPASPPSTDPTSTLPEQSPSPPADADPGAAVPPAPPVPPPDDDNSGGNG
jgi:predicted small lipoprotein YifL